jgi:hypothetical protein
MTTASHNLRLAGKLLALEICYRLKLDSRNAAKLTRAAMAFVRTPSRRAHAPMTVLLRAGTRHGIALLLAAGVAIGAATAGAQRAGDQDGDEVPDARDNCVFASNPPSSVAGTQLDADADGAGDACDICPESAADVPARFRPPRLVTNPKGCSLSQTCPCNRVPKTWRRRTAYLRCIRKNVHRLRRGRLITSRERRTLTAKARKSVCGRLPGRPGDMDGDGIPDDGGAALCKDRETTSCDDNCMRRWNPKQRDMNGDGEGDACDTDRDGDGVRNRKDTCPYVKNETQVDADGDGLGDACDACNDSEEGADVNAKGCEE